MVVTGHKNVLEPSEKIRDGFSALEPLKIPLTRELWGKHVCFGIDLEVPMEKKVSVMFYWRISLLVMWVVPS